MSNEQVQAIEKSIRNAKKAVEIGAAVERLRSNRDFKLVVLDGYLEQESIRLVHLKAAPEFQSPERQASVIRDIDSIGAFAAYLNNQISFAAMASKQLESDQETLADLAEEELNNG